MAARTRYPDQKRPVLKNNDNVVREVLLLELEEIELHLSIMRSGYQQQKLTKSSVLFLMKECTTHLENAKKLLH